MSNLLTCKSCGLVDCITTQTKGVHTLAYCAGCGAYIKHLPTQEPKLYVGKYKGVPIDQIEDISYLEWAQKTLKLGASVRDAINYQIQSLKLTHR